MFTTLRWEEQYELFYEVILATVVKYDWYSSVHQKGGQLNEILCAFQGVAVHDGKILYSDPDYERIYQVDENGQNEKILRSNLLGVSVVKAYSERHTSGEKTCHRQLLR